MSLPYVESFAGDTSTIPAGTCVKVGADGTTPSIAQNDTAGGACLGITNDVPNPRDSQNLTPVVQLGPVRAVAGAAITMGQWVMSDAAGKVIPLGVTGGTNYDALGFAMGVASNSGDIIKIFVTKSRPQG